MTGPLPGSTEAAGRGVGLAGARSRGAAPREPGPGEGGERRLEEEQRPEDGASAVMSSLIFYR